MSKMKTGLVLSGGGARGAYEAGVLHYIRTKLSPKLRASRFDILCGCSVGAINTCFFASTIHDPLEQTKQLVDLWSHLSSSQIYERTPVSLLSLILRSTGSILSNLTQINFFETKNKTNHFQALLDTKPLEKFLKKNIQWDQIKSNILSNHLESVSLIATQHQTGRTSIFLQTGSQYFKSDRFDVSEIELKPLHAMASAAIPLVFPSVKIDSDYYVDGGVRMNTPLSPAIHLGAEKLLIIGLHAETTWPKNIDASSRPPTLGEHLGKLFHSFLLDNLKNDVSHLKQVNHIIDIAKNIYGKDFCDKMNKNLDYQYRLNEIESLLIQPSIPLSEVFEDWYSRNKDKTHISLLEKFLMKALDVQPAVSGDLLSYLAFEGGYLESLVDLGFKDAGKNHDQLENFFAL